MRLGVAYGVVMPWMTNGVHPDEHFMPESFKAAGYQTGMAGKWHLGHAQETYTPRARGFEHFYGHLHMEVGYFPPFNNQGVIRVVSVMRWPAQIEAGSKRTSIMSAMDIFPKIADAAGIERQNQFELDGRSLWPAIREGESMPRDEPLFFASETPIRGTFNITAFDDEWKLIQRIDQGLLSAEVQNWLFKTDDDPYERNNLAEAHPEVVNRMAEEIHAWRMMHPLSGTRHALVPPPGWRAPLD